MRRLLPVDDHGQTAVPHIYAAGDMLVVPRPWASQAMEDGRRAVSQALGLLVGESVNQVPIGIYTILKLPPSG